jgi:DNA-binding NtrC family response regulator
VERAVVLAVDDVIGLNMLPAKMRLAEYGSPKLKSGTYKLNELVEQTEREAIVTALRISGNNRSQAIKALGISRAGFYQKMEKYGLGNSV